MKPYQLKISAFGPFAKTVDLNFKEDLQNDKIFVITGPTGAGKTTIFDAICYALYGESSGASRKGDQLRSDFSASLDLLTSVELTFGIRQKVYTIKRQPKQQAPKKRGEGYREVPASVELLEHDSDRPPLTKDGDVKQEISQVLGLTVDQFRKIIMIPQGDFKEFLVANTMAKEELLRKIFGTHIYKNIQEKLAETATQLKEKVAATQQEIQSMLQTLPLALENPDTLEALKSEIASAQLEKTTHLSNLEATKKQISLLREQLTEAESLNQKFQDKEALEASFQKIQAKSSEMEILKQEIQQIRQASLIQVLENNKIRSETALQKISATEAETTLKLNQLKKELEAAQANYEQLPDSELKIKASIEQESKLSGWLQELKGLQQEKDKLLAEKSEEQVLREKLEAVQIKLKDAESKLTVLEPKRLERLQLENAISGLEKKVVELSEEVSDSQKNLGDFALWEQARGKLEKLTQVYESRHQQALKLQQIYEQKAAQFIHAAAARLAQELKVDHPCPVCGALEHPNPATTAEAPLSKEELEQYKDDYDLALAAEKQAQQQFSEAQLAETALKGTFTSDSHTQLQERLQGSKTALIATKSALIKEQEKKTQLETIISQLETMKQNMGPWQTQQEQLSKQVVALQISIQATNQNLNTAYSKIPEIYHTLEPLQNELKMLQSERAKLERDIEQTRRQYEQTTSNLQNTEGTLTTLRTQKATANEDLSQAAAEFDGEWTKSFENLEAYQQSASKLNRLSEMERLTQNFATEFHSTKQRLEHLVDLLSGKSLQDLVPLNDQLQESELQKDDFTASILQADQLISQLTQVHQFVSVRYEKIKDQEAEYAVIGELSELANGKKGGKMTFETYVLSGYFDVVLEAANTRLQKMTSNRYRLLRREEIKGGGRKGLELDVYDSHTCKSRPINTLSGGESFKASLALALGLSDTVQQTTGGIELNTMFIDEGFGTLDPHSLEQAVDILMDLQEHGRLIGVISHVAELKDRIPAKLVVTAGPAGSEAAFDC